MEKNIYIIVGHYGSGKTEFAINFALWREQRGAKVAIADLDIVNPYFRTRQQAEMLGAHGVRVVSSSLGHDWRIDLPALDSEIQSFFVPENGRENIVDVGGNAAGARVLARFRDEIAEGSYHMWLVANANRYESQTADETIAFANSIMETSGLRITGIVNNTHLLQETALEDVLRGSAVEREVSGRMGIPVVYSACPRWLWEECMAHRDEIAGELFAIDMTLRPDYLKQTPVNTWTTKIQKKEEKPR